MLPPPARHRACALVLPTPPQGGSGAHETVCARTPKIQSRAKKCPNGMTNIRHSRGSGNPASGHLSARRQESAHMAPSAIPAKAGIQCKLSAVRAHCSAGRRAPVLKGARSARFICWIPAFAGMAEGGRGNGGMGCIRWMLAGFLHSLFRRNDEVGGRNGGVGGRNDEVGFIRWMSAGFLHSLGSGAPWRTRVSRFSSLRLRNGLGRDWGRHVD